MQARIGHKSDMSSRMGRLAASDSLVVDYRDLFPGFLQKISRR